MSFQSRYSRVLSSSVFPLSADLRRMRIERLGAVVLQDGDADVDPDRRATLRSLGVSEYDIDGMSKADAEAVINEKRSGPLTGPKLEEVTKLKKTQGEEASKVNKSLDKEHGAFSAQADRLKKELAEISSEMEKVYNDIASLDDISEDDYEALSSRDKKKREDLHDAYSEGVEVLRGYQSAFMSQLSALEKGSKLRNQVDYDDDFILDDDDDYSFDSDLTDNDLDRLRRVNVLLEEKGDILKELSSWRLQEHGLFRKLEVLRRKDSKAYKTYLSAIKSGAGHAEIAHLKSSIGSNASEMKSLERELATASKEILALEKKVLSSRKKERLLVDEDEYANRYPDLPEQSAEFAQQIKDTNTNDRQELGREVSDKYLSDNEFADSMRDFLHKEANVFDPFIRSHIAASIPSDGVIDKKLADYAREITRFSDKMRMLSEKFKNSPVNRSAIRLMGSLYQLMSSALEATIDPDMSRVYASYNEMLQVCAALDSEGFHKEAINLQKAFGDLKDKAGSLVDAVKGTYTKIKRAKELASLKKEDVGPARDPKKALKDQRESYRQMQEVSRELDSRIEESRALMVQYRAAKDTEGEESMVNLLVDMQTQKRHVTEALKGLETSSEGPKSLTSQASALVRVHEEELTTILQRGLPDSPALIREMKGLALMMSKIAGEMAKEASKRGAEYPSLPPAIYAYHTMVSSLTQIFLGALTG